MNTSGHNKTHALMIIAILFLNTAFAVENWPHWRGPDNNGISHEKGLPATWSKTENVKWRLKLPGSAPSTPVIYRHDSDEQLIVHGADYVTANSLKNGILLCVDAKTGELVYRQSIYRRRHRASLVYADGKIFLAATDRTVNVIKPGRDYALLATNSLDETLLASPAISNSTIYLRTYEALYAIGKK